MANIVQDKVTLCLARDEIYTFRAYATMSVSVCDGSALAHYS